MNFKTLLLLFLFQAVRGEELPNAFNDLIVGLKQAYNHGRNGIYLNSYSYHLTIPRHLPNFYVMGDNEFTIGTGYARSYLNSSYNSEYTLGVLGFLDSEYKPEIHVGYTYLKYWNVTNHNFKAGLGYAPFVFIKPAWTKDAPIPFLGIAVLSDLKFYDNINFQTWYTGSLLFFNIRLDF